MLNNYFSMSSYSSTCRDHRNAMCYVIIIVQMIRNLGVPPISTVLRNVFSSRDAKLMCF